MRKLYSFPTRRSSGLVEILSDNRVKVMVNERNIASIIGRGGSNIKRSEENTSELQSPNHLVCRLLLEKKKQEAINTHTNTD